MADAQPDDRRRVFSGGPYEDQYGYCRAVRVGEQVYVAGTTARTLDGDAYAQSVEALDIIESALGEVGSSVADVVRTTAFAVDRDDVSAIAQAHRERFGSAPPVSTLVLVAGLIDPRMRVEFEVTAVRRTPAG